MKIEFRFFTSKWKCVFSGASVPTAHPHVLEYSTMSAVSCVLNSPVDAIYLFALCVVDARN